MTDLSRFKTKRREGNRVAINGKHYQVRRGRFIEYETLNPIEPKKPRAGFQARWAKLPKYWVEALRRVNQANTLKLALRILFETTTLELEGKRGVRITLSSGMTGMPRSSRKRAVRELVKLDLIDVEQRGREAPRVLAKHIPTR
jgi:hypothetical protein